MLRSTRQLKLLRPSIHGGSRLALRRWNSGGNVKQHDPLNILFCGADEFSIHSLRALREFQDTRPEQIESIEVVCKPDKRVGRGLKQLHEGSCLMPVSNSKCAELTSSSTDQEGSKPARPQATSTRHIQRLVAAFVNQSHHRCILRLASACKDP